MSEFLILKLQGVMQSWGGHTYEDLRHSELFPTRSALIGLLAACLGIDREEKDKLKALNASLRITVRSDDPPDDRQLIKITDYHTIEGARTVKGPARKNLTPTRREYLCDACFTVALEHIDQADFRLGGIKTALQNPVFTPFLGRRACPLSRPLYEDIVEADDAFAALRKIHPYKGLVYAEQEFSGANRMRMRDVALYRHTRQFMTRDVWFRTDPPKEADL